MTMLLDSPPETAPVALANATPVLTWTGDRVAMEWNSELLGNVAGVRELADAEACRHAAAVEAAVAACEDAEPVVALRAATGRVADLTQQLAERRRQHAELVALADELFADGKTEDADACEEKVAEAATLADRDQRRLRILQDAEQQLRGPADALIRRAREVAVYQAQRSSAELLAAARQALAEAVARPLAMFAVATLIAAEARRLK